ncbi:MAG: FtsX-like permease family protein [Planctomycetes bacterium]|nr:FtsX-like permease family protein [Planctomycetota bacterium]
MKAPLGLFAWACRQIVRQPGTALLTGITICTLVTASATVLLLEAAFATTARELLGAGPSHVVRAVDATGWRPLIAGAAAETARSVVGVTAARPRLWGVVRSAGGAAVTALGVVDPAEFPTLGQAPQQGQAIVGPGVALDAVDGAPHLTLAAAGGNRTFVVTTQLDAASGLALHDAVLLHADDSRTVLGLGPEQASDLAVWVYHDAEQAAVAQELAAAFGGAVRVTTRTEAIGAAIAGFAREGSLRLLLLVPATLALCLLLVVAVRRGRSARRELGLYKALGWSTGDLVRLQLYGALAVSVPAVLLGLAGAGWLVFGPARSWPAQWLFAWPGRAPVLVLTPAAGLQVAFGVASTVLVPWLCATLLPALRSATVDPQDLLRGGRA